MEKAEGSHEPRSSDPTALLEQIEGLAKEASYVAVGLGVLGVQKLQARRVALEQQLPEGLRIDDRLKDLRSTLGRHADEIDGVMAFALHRLDAALDPIEHRLPPPARDVTKLAQAGAHEARVRLRKLITQT